jgi:chorismate synthase
LDVLDADFSFRSNHSGGIQGGIANGEDIFFRVAFKPIASLAMEVPLTAVDGSMVTKKIGGRHDVCQVPRAVPVVEAMAAIVLADMLLLAR